MTIIIFNDFLLFYRQNDNNKMIFKKIKGRLIFLLVAYICTTMFLSTSKTDQNTGATWFQWVTCFSENGHFKLTNILKELPSSGAKDGLRAESQRWCKEDGICRKTDWRIVGLGLLVGFVDCQKYGIKPFLLSSKTKALFRIFVRNKLKELQDIIFT